MEVKEKICMDHDTKFYHVECFELRGEFKSKQEMEEIMTQGKAKVEKEIKKKKYARAGTLDRY